MEMVRVELRAQVWVEIEGYGNRGHGNWGGRGAREWKGVEMGGIWERGNGGREKAGVELSSIEIQGMGGMEIGEVWDRGNGEVKKVEWERWT